MTIPWGPLECLAGACVVALLYKKYAPPQAQGISSPIWWAFLLLSVAIFGTLAISLAQT